MIPRRLPPHAPPVRQSPPVPPPPRTFVVVVEKSWRPTPDATPAPQPAPPPPAAFDWLDALLIILTGGLTLVLAVFMGPGKPMGSNHKD